MAWIKRCGIYIITCNKSNKVYIGSSKSIKKRLASHKNRLRGNKHCNSHLQRAWNTYGQEYFTFGILDILPREISRRELEKVETEYVLKYNSHKREYGYNLTLPGSIPLREEDENECKIGVNIGKRDKGVILINLSTGEKREFSSYEEASKFSGIKRKKICDMVLYWYKETGKRSSKSWIAIKEELYNPEFEYLTWHRERKTLSEEELKRRRKERDKRKVERGYYKKRPEDIIPIEKRNIKRISVIAENKATGEQRQFPSMLECSTALGLNYKKVSKVLQRGFKERSHRGFYLKRA